MFGSPQTGHRIVERANAIRVSLGKARLPGYDYEYRRIRPGQVATVAVPGQKARLVAPSTVNAEVERLVALP